MKGNITRTTQVVLFVIAFCMSMASTTKAQGPECSQALAAGKYANSMDGFIAGFPYAAVEQVTVDAAGNFTSTHTSSWNGSIAHATLTGKITVNADCTGTANWTRSESGAVVSFGTLELLVDDDMREVRFVVTSITLNDLDRTLLSVTLKGEGRKVFPRHSNQQ